MFAGMLRYADKLIGDLVAEITRLGLRENTVIFVASDNGTEKRFAARRNGRKVQGDLYSLSEAGGNVVAAACVVDRSGGKVDVGVPLVALARMSVPAYPADDLPPELAAIPIEDPGSRRLKA